ncbi:protein of unknown function [uncultured Woeseiaceae bacterium]|uniref:Uncharacterized protein n=1 Tax=uncultured Woeseiaceae bacterium TaxID=1983305 RepID=A0A7D9H5E4_9GAMM|nr:protein of unknown function [uncultured Woeseiaceae bacterium]
MKAGQLVVITWVLEKDLVYLLEESGSVEPLIGFTEDLSVDILNE